MLAPRGARVLEMMMGLLLSQFGKNDVAREDHVLAHEHGRIGQAGEHRDLRFAVEAAHAVLRVDQQVHADDRERLPKPGTLNVA